MTQGDGKLAGRLLEKPRYLSLVYPAWFLLREGFEEGLPKLRSILGEEYYNLFNRPDFSQAKDLMSTIIILDNYILDPHIRRSFLRLFQSEISEGSNRDLTRIIGIDRKRILKIIRDLSETYSLFEKYYYVTIKDAGLLSTIMNKPLSGIVVTKDMIRRSSWLTRLFFNGNSIIINGEEFSGRRTHAYLIARILLQGHGIPLIHKPRGTVVQLNAPILLQDASIQDILQNKDKKFIAYTKNIDPLILEEFIGNKLLVVSEDDVGRNLGVKNKVILFHAGKSIYSQNELDEIAKIEGLPEPRNLLQLHINSIMPRLGLRETYNNLSQFIRRVLPRLYFTGKIGDLVSLIYGALNDCTIIPAAIPEVLAKEWDRKTTIMDRLAPRVYGIPHPAWNKIVRAVISEENNRELLGQFIELVQSIRLFKTSIAIRARTIYETLALAFCQRPMIENLCKKGFLNLIQVAPVHYFDESISLRLTGIRNTLITKGLTQKLVEEILREYLDSGQYIESTGLRIDKRLKAISSLSVQPRDLVRQRDLMNMLEDLKNEETLFSYAIRMLYPEKIWPSSIMSVSDAYRKMNNASVGFKIGVALKDVPEIMRRSYRRKLALKCFLIGDYKCLSSSRELASQYYKHYIEYRLGLSSNAYKGFFRLQTNLLEKASHLHTTILPPLLKTYEILTWLSINRDERETAGKMLEEYRDILSTYSLFLPAYYVQIHNHRIALLESLVKNTPPSTISSLWDIVLLGLIGEESREKWKTAVQTFTSSLGNINSVNAKLAADAALTLYKRGLIEWDNLLSMAEKMSGKTPYLSLQALRLLMIGLKHAHDKRDQIDLDKTRGIVERLIGESRVMGEWVLIYKAIMYRRLAHLYRKVNVSRSLNLLEEALSTLNMVKNLPSIFTAEQKTYTLLWYEITRMLAGKRDTCYQVLKKIMTRPPRNKRRMVKYWFAKCKLYNGLYRSAFEDASELVISEKNPYFKTIYAILAYKAARRLPSRYREQYLKILIDNLGKLELNDEALYLVERIVSFILQISKTNLSDSARLAEALFNKILSDKRFLGRIMSSPRMVKGFSKIIVELRGTLTLSLSAQLSRAMREITTGDPTLVKNLAISMINAGSYREAAEYIKEHQSLLSKDEYRLLEAIISLRKGEEKKAYKTALKIKREISDELLKPWLNYLRGKALLAKNRRKEGLRELRKLIGVTPPVFAEELHADAYRIVGESLLLENKQKDASPLLLEATRKYEKVVFKHHKIDRLEVLRSLTNTLASISRETDSYHLANMIKREICGRIERYRRMLHPEMFARYFGDLWRACRQRGRL